MNKKKAIRELADAIQRLANIPDHHPGHPVTLGTIVGNLQGAMEALGIEALTIEDNAITTAHRAIEGGRNA